MSATPLPSLRPVQRLFIANRGEIALRILRAARSLNLEVVIGVSEADRHTQAARLADRAVCIGPAPALESYLNRNAIVQAALGLSDAILEAAGLGFLGLGAQPPTPEWGAMLADTRDLMISHPWVMAFPGLAILTTVLAINLMGDGLRDALDPRLRRS